MILCSMASELSNTHRCQFVLLIDIGVILIGDVNEDHALFLTKIKGCQVSRFKRLYCPL